MLILSTLVVLSRIDCLWISGVLNEMINSYLTNGFSHHYHLGESTFIFRGVRNDF